MCDRLFHCPEGEDEVSCYNHSCNGLFKCSHSDSVMCLHQSSICDGVVDCLSREDENLCDLPQTCSHFCQCLLYAVSCANVELERIQDVPLFNFIFVQFTGVSFETKATLMRRNCAVVFIWRQSNLEDICAEHVSLSNLLQHLDYSHNLLTEIEDFCFQNYQRLRVLQLSKNQIYLIHPSAFATLGSLVKLDISVNEILHLNFDVFATLETNVLNISNNKLVTIVYQSTIEVEAVFTDDYRICCLVQSDDITCTAKATWPQSCSIILNSLSSKILVVLETLMILSLNMSCILNVVVTHVFCSETSKNKEKRETLSPFTVLLVGLCLNDYLFGVYLLSIFSADAHFGDDYVVYTDQWLAGMFCNFLGILSTCVLLHSFFILFTISLSRFVAVKYPLNTQIKSVKKTRRSLITGFSLTTLIAVSFSISYRKLEGNRQMPSPACTLLGETTGSTTIKTATLLVVTSQIGLLFLTGIFYFEIWRELKKRQNIISSQKIASRKREKHIAQQAVLITVTNALCWIPSSIIYIFSVAAEQFPTSLLVWNATLVNPLNAVLNPMIFFVLPIVRRKLKTGSFL